MRVTASILLFLFISLFCRANELDLKPNLADTSDLIFNIDDNVVVLDKEIVHKDFWMKALSENVLFIDYFKKKSSNKRYIYIKDIKIDKARSYIFRILSRNLILKPAFPNGYCNYKFIFLPRVNGELKLIKISNIGCEI